MLRPYSDILSLGEEHMQLTWNQVHAWRLARHHLLEPAKPAALLQVVQDICGLHAQLMPAAELSLSARVRDISPDDVQDALWKKRTLVKTWAMRGTLHLLTAADFPVYVAAMRTKKNFRRASWQKFHGVTLEELEAIMAGARAILTDTGMTREQLADALAEHTQTPKLAELLRSGWGAILKPVAFQGDICFGENQGQNVTFVLPRKWLGEWKPVKPDDALRELARRFLSAYAPATAEEFARWFGVDESDGKRLFRALVDDEAIVAVEIDDWKGWALPEAVEHMANAQPAHAVNLLPHFDTYTVTLAKQNLVPEVYRGRVYRPQGWIAPVVLVDGRIAGVWERDKKTLNIDLFDPLTDAIRHGIEVESKRIGAFLDTEIETVYR